MSSVQFNRDGKRVEISLAASSSGWNPTKNELFFIVDNIDQAQALRDALNAFLAFHQRGAYQAGDTVVPGMQKPADVE